MEALQAADNFDALNAKLRILVNVTAHSGLS